MINLLFFINHFFVTYLYKWQLISIIYILNHICRTEMLFLILKKNRPGRDSHPRISPVFLHENCFCRPAKIHPYHLSKFLVKRVSLKLTWQRVQMGNTLIVECQGFVGSRSTKETGNGVEGRKKGKAGEENNNNNKKGKIEGRPVWGAGGVKRKRLQRKQKKRKKERIGRKRNKGRKKAKYFNFFAFYLIFFLRCRIIIYILFQLKLYNRHYEQK